MNHLRLFFLTVIIGLSASVLALDHHLYQFSEAQAAWDIEEFGDRSPNNSCYARTTRLLRSSQSSGAALMSLPDYCSNVWAHHLYVIWYSTET